MKYRLHEITYCSLNGDENKEFRPQWWCEIDNLWKYLIIDDKIPLLYTKKDALQAIKDAEYILREKMEKGVYKILHKYTEVTVE